MKSLMKGATLAAGAMICLAASQAFADLEVVSRQEEPDSWSTTYAATVGGSGLTAFDRFRVTILGPVSYTISGTTYNILTPTKLEDINPTHYAIQDFTGSGGGTAAGWAQTSITPPIASSTYADAAGTVNSTVGGTLQYKIYFEGVQGTGTHYSMEFFNGGYSASNFVIGYEVKDIFNATLYPSRPDGYERTAYLTLVPLPGSAWSGLALMGGLGLVLARRRRNSVIA